jgi:hypothetical protein
VSQASVGDILVFGYASSTEVSLRNRIIALVVLQRLGVTAIGFFPLSMAASLFPTESRNSAFIPAYTVTRPIKNVTEDGPSQIKHTFL